MDHSGTAQEESVHVQIGEIKNISDDVQPESASIFEPRLSSIGRRESDDAFFYPALRPAVRAPEKKLTLFALRLAILEKSATGLGALSFIWATVVLLGGFAITLTNTDFWFITTILLIEGTRIFSRSHEIEWQHQAAWSLTESGINSFRFLQSSSSSVWKSVMSIFKPISSGNMADRNIKEAPTKVENPKKWDGKHLLTRRWATADVPLLPHAPWVFVASNISKILQLLQIAAAVTCVVLSLIKLIIQNYGEIEKGDTDKRNRKAALSIFYGLALAEASLFLLEKIYWEYKVIYHKLLDKVNAECDLGSSGIIPVRRFFYDAYSKCVNGSIFDGLKMDMVTFAMELLGSNSPDEQLMGALILQRFAMSQRFSDDTLQKIGITFSTVERLIEMLNWKEPQEEDIRIAAADILSKLAGKKQNSLRIAGIPGAMESISSLLHSYRTLSSAAEEIGEKSMIVDQEHYDFWTINNLGLLILKKLAHDHENCGKIGNTRGLLAKIIDFTHAEERLLMGNNIAESQIQMVKRSLQVVKRLASTTGATGKQLRREISENVFTISNVRDILRHAQKHPELQNLGIEILTSLAMEDDATERIGGTGGILKELLNIFFKYDMPEPQSYVRAAAGEALVMLALESRQNCQHILKLGALQRLVEALEVELLRENAARILRNLCTYSAEESFCELRKIVPAAPTVSLPAPKR